MNLTVGCEKLINYLEQILTLVDYDLETNPQLVIPRSYVQNGLQNIALFRDAIQSNRDYNVHYVKTGVDGYQQPVTSSYEQFKAAFDKPIDKSFDKLAEEHIEDYSSMTIPQLKEILREKGLKLGGNKADLLQRLMDSSY